MRIPAILLSALFALPATVLAGDCLPVVEAGWVRQPPMPMPMMGGFATVRNPCEAPVRVVGASSPSFGSVELHETTRVDGVSRMRHIHALDVPAGGSVKLAPGGLHLMLMQPVAPLERGASVPVELELADGRRLRGDFEVRAPDAL